jgi:hypothetical protein
VSIFISNEHTKADILGDLPNTTDIKYEPLQMDGPIESQTFLLNRVNYKSALSSFSLFFPDPLFETIVKDTNEYARIPQPPIPPGKLKDSPALPFDTILPQKNRLMVTAPAYGLNPVGIIY